MFGFRLLEGKEFCKGLRPSEFFVSDGLLYKGLKKQGVMILFQFMHEMGIVVGLQDCVRKTRSFFIKTKNPLH